MQPQGGRCRARSTATGDALVTLSRRHLIAGFGTVAIAGSGLIAGLRPAAAQDANLLELLKAGPLGDKILGSESAPVTIVEYASVTCGACAAFHTQTYPTLKSKYIETGKVRLILREFPTGPVPVAIGGFMLARCANEKYFPMIEAIFDQQRSWAQDPYNGFLRIARQAGFTQESFDACLKDEKVAEQIQQVAQRGNEEFKVDSTPTFFINGKKYVGVISVAELDKILEPLLKSS
jgi:protein-disulfide isomerase